MTRTRTPQARKPMSLRRKLALTSALGMSLVVVATPAVAQTVGGPQGSFGTVDTTATNDITIITTPTPVSAPAPKPTFTLSTDTTTGGERLDVDLNARNTVINWTAFNVPAVTDGKTKVVSFNNGLAFSDGVGAGTTTDPKAVLNRITGATATEISGIITTGTRTVTGVTPGATNIAVWIVNGSGIMVGAGANINTGGLVLSGIGLNDTQTDAFRTTAAGNAYAVGFNGTAGGIGQTAASGATPVINTNNGVLALIAKNIDLTANTDSGTGPTAFVIASDVNFSFSPGGPLSLVVNAGTGVTGTSSINGAIVGDRVYALLKPQDGMNALLAVNAGISNATVDAKGVVVLSGGNLASEVPLDAVANTTNKDSLSTGTSGPNTFGKASVGAITFRSTVNSNTPTTGTVTLASTGILSGSSVATAGDITISGSDDATFTGTLTSGLGKLTVDRGGAVSVGAIAVAGAATIGAGTQPTSFTVTNPTASVTSVSANSLSADAGAGGITIAGGVSTTGTTSLTSTGAIKSAAVTAGTGAKVSVEGKSIDLGAVSAGTTASLTATGTSSGDDATVASVSAGTNVTISSGSNGLTTVNGAVTATNGFYSVSGGSVSITAGAQKAGGAVTATATGGSGTVTLANAVTVTAGSLTVSAGSGITSGADVTTTGSQDYQSSLALTDDVTLKATGAGGAVTIGGALTNSSGSHALTVSAEGDKTFNGTIGTAGSALSALTTTGGSGATVFGAGVVSIDAGAQAYGAVSLGGNLIVNGASASFGTITGGGKSLTLNLTGSTTLNSASGLGTLSSGNGGTTFLNGAISADSQIYDDNVELTGTTTLTATAGGVAFNGTLNGGSDLTVNTSGLTRFGTVGGTVALTSLTTDAGGTTKLNGDVTTTGAQSFGEAVTLVTDAVLTAGTGGIGFGATVDGAKALTVVSNSAKSFAAAVGATTQLTSLTSSGSGVTSFGNGVGTVNADTQSYGAVSLGAADIAFNGTDATFADTITGSGSGLVLNLTGATVLNGASTVSALTSGGGGTTTLNGSITTAGPQTYADNVVLGSATTVDAGSGGSITFSGTLRGPYALTANAGGTTKFGAVGQGGPLNALASLTTDAAGSTVLNGNVATMGGQTYNDAVQATGTTQTLSSTANGDIHFSSALTAAAASQELILATGGNIYFGGNVGLGTPFGKLTTTQPTGTTTVSGGFAVNADTITFAGSTSTTGTGTVTLNGGTGGVDLFAFGGTNARVVTSTSDIMIGALTGMGSVSLTPEAAGKVSVATLGTGDTDRLGELTIGQGGDITLGTGGVTAFLTKATIGSIATPVGTLTLNGFTDHSDNFTAISSGTVTLGDNVFGDGALSVTSDGDVLGDTLDGAGNKTLVANLTTGTIRLTGGIFGTGAVDLTGVTIMPGDIGKLGRAAASLTVTGGDLTLGATYVSGAAALGQISGEIQSITATGILSAGSLVAETIGDQLYSGDVTTAADARIEAGGKVETRGSVQTGTDVKAAKRGLTIYSGTGDLAVGADTNGVSIVSGAGVLLSARLGTSKATISGDVSANGGAYAASGAGGLRLTGGVHRATGAVMFSSGAAITLDAGVSVTSNTDNTGTDLLTIGSATTGALALTGSSLTANADGTGEIRFGTATDTSAFALGNVAAGTLSQQIGAGAVTAGIDRSGSISTNDLTLSGSDSIASDGTLDVTGAVATGGSLTLQGDNGVTVTGALTNLASTSGAVTLNSVNIAGSGVTFAGATLTGALSVNTSSVAKSTGAISASKVDTTASSINYGDVSGTTGVVLTATSGNFTVHDVTSTAGNAVLRKNGNATGDLFITGKLSSLQNTVQSATNIRANTIVGPSGATGGDAIEAAGYIDGTTTATGVVLDGTGGTQFLRAGTGITIASKTRTVALDAQTAAGDVTLLGDIGATGDRTDSVRLVADAGDIVAIGKSIYTSGTQMLTGNSVTTGLLDSSGTITLTGDTVSVGAVTTTGAADIIASRRSSTPAGTSFAATSLTSGRDVIIDTPSAFATFTATGASAAARNFTVRTTGTLALGSVDVGTGGALDAASDNGPITFATLSGGGSKSLLTAGAITGTAIEGVGTVTLLAFGAIAVDRLGIDTANRIGVLTIDGSSAVTLGATGATGTNIWLTSAAIGQNSGAPVAALTINGDASYSGSFTSTTTGATSLGDVAGGGALSLTAATLDAGALSTTALAGTIRLKSDAITVGAVGTTDTGADIVADSVTTAGSTFSATSVSSGRDVLIGQVSPFGSVTLTALSKAAGSFTATATGATSVAAITGGTGSLSLISGSVTATGTLSTTTGNIALTANKGALTVASVTSTGGNASLATTGSIASDVTINGTLSSAQNTVQSNRNILANTIVGTTGSTAATGIQAAGFIDGLTTGAGVTLGGTGGSQLLRAGNGITIKAKTGTVGLDAQSTTAGDVTVVSAIGATSDRTASVRLVSDTGNVSAQDIYTSGTQTLSGNTLGAGMLDSNGASGTIALTGFAVTVGTVTTTGATADIVANRLGSTVAGSSFGATSLSSARDVLIGQTSPFETIALTGSSAATNFTVTGTGAVGLGSVDVGNALTVSPGNTGVTFATLRGAGSKTVTSGGAIGGTGTGGAGAAITGAGAVTLIAAGAIRVDAVGTGTGAGRIGLLTIDGSSGVTLGTPANTVWLTGASIGQNSGAPVTLFNVKGGLDYSGTFTATTGGATTLRTVTGGGALTLTAGGLLTTSTVTTVGPIALTGDMIDVGALTTTGGTSNIVANSATTGASSFSAISLASAQDVLIGQTSPFGTITLTGPSLVTRNFTADATGVVQLGTVSIGTALDVETTGTMLTFATLSGAGSKTLKSGGAINGASIMGAGAVSLQQTGATMVGFIGAPGAAVGALALNGGNVSIGATYVTGAITSSNLGSLTANGLIDAGSLTVTTTGAQTFSSTVTTAAQTALTSTGGLVTTTGLVNAGTNSGAADRSLSITGKSVTAGALQAGSSIAVTGTGTVAGNRDVSVTTASAGTSVAIVGQAITTVSGNVSAGTSYTASGGTLNLTGGTQQAAGAVMLGGGIVNVSSGVTVLSNSDASGNEMMTVGDATTAEFHLTGSTLQAGTDNAGTIRFVSATNNTPFEIGNVVAGTLKQQIGSGPVTDLDRAGNLSFGNLTLSGTNSITTSGAPGYTLTTNAITVGNGALTLSATGAATVNGAIANMGATNGAVSITGGTVAIQGAMLAGALTLSATSTTAGQGVTYTTLAGSGTKTLNAAQSISGGGITGAGAVILNPGTAGGVTIGGDIGASGAQVASLTVTRGGTVSLGRVFATGNVDLGQTAAIGSLAVGNITLGGNLTSDTTGKTMLAFVFTAAGTQAVDVEAGTDVSFATIQGAASKRLKAGTDIVGTAILDAGAITLIAGGAIDLGRAGATGRAATSLTIDAVGTVDLGSALLPSVITGAVTIGATSAPAALRLLVPFTAGSFSLKSAGDINTDTLTASTGAIAALSTGGVITFGGTVDGPGTLTVQAANGTTFNAAVGGTTAFSSFTSTGASTGKVTVRGGSLKTVAGATGTQSYGGLLTLGADTVLTGGSATFSGGVQGNDGTRDHDLTLNFDQAQSLTGGGIAGVRNLATDLAGSTTLTGIVSTSGTQTYNDPVTIGGAVTVQSSGAGAAGNIVFTNTVDAGTDLTVITPGTVRFAGVVGGAAPLNSITTTGAAATEIQANVTTARNQTYSATTLNGAADVSIRSTLIGFGPSFAGLSGPRGLYVNATLLKIVGNNGAALSSIIHVAGGAAQLSGKINTVGSQDYYSPVTLIGNTTLAGTAVNANTITGGGFDLTLNTSGAQLLFNGISGVHDLVTDAAGSLTLGNSISTTGLQNYGESAVTLAAATTLSAGTTISFAGTVNGAQTLTTNATQTIFNKDVGTGTALTSLAVTGPAVTAGTGTRIINTSAGQTYNGGLLLGLDTQLVGAGAVLGAGTQIDGSASNYNLRLTFSGANALIANPLTRVGNLLVDGAGTTTLNGNVTTVGSQTWTSALTIGAATALASSGNAFITLNTVGGTSALSVNTGGATNLNGPIGGITALTTDAGGTTTINTAAITTTSGVQTYNDSLVLGVDTVLTANGAAATSGIVFNGTVTGPKALTTTSLGQTSFNAAVGGTLMGGAPNPAVSPTTISVTGPTTINTAAITTASTQTYTGTVTLGAHTVLTGTTAVFGGNVIGGGFDLTLNTSGAQALGNTISGVRNLTTDAAGTLTLSGTIGTTGNQSYNDAVTLGGTTALTAGGTIAFATTVNGAQALTTSALTTTFNADVGTAMGGALSSLAVSGSAVTAGTGTRVLRTTGVQTYNGGVLLGLDAQLIGAGTVLGAGTQIDGSASNRNLQLTFSMANALIANPLTRVGTLLVNGAGTTTLNGNVTTVGSQTWTSALTIGAATALASSGNAFITLNTVGGTSALSVNTGGATNLNGPIGGITALTTDAGGTTTINTAAITTTSGVQTYGDSLVLGVDTVLTASGAAATSGIVFNGTVTGPKALTTTSLGQTSFNAAVGGTLMGGAPNVAVSPTTLSVTGPTTINTAAITTASTQTYTGLVTLGAHTVLTGTTAGFGNNIVGGGFDLTLNMSGAQALGNTISGVRNLTTDAAGTLTLSGTIGTSGNQSYNDAVTLGGTTALTAGGTIAFANTVNGAQALTTSATTTTFNADVGATTALTSLQVTGSAVTAGTGTRVLRTTGAQTYNNGVLLGLNTQLVGAGAVLGAGTQIDGSASNYNLQLTFSGANALIVNPLTRVGNLLVDGAGTTTLSGNVTTVGSQTWTSALTIGAATALASSGNAFITLNTVGGTSALSVNTGGATNLNGPIGGITALTTDAGGTTTINTAAITTTSGVQTYGDNVVLGSGLATGTTLTANGTAAASGITFNGTVTGPKMLTVASAGQTTFNGVVGGLTMGGAIDAAVSPTALTSTGTGIVRINGGAITTNGNQSYAGVVQLGADTVLRGTTGTFTSGIVGNLAGSNYDLRLNFANPVSLSGTSGGFDDLLVDNAANLTGIIIANTQTYNGAVTLTGDTTLRSGATGTGTGNIVFNSSVDATAAGGQALTVTTGGTTSLKSVGATQAVSAVMINGTGPITLNGPSVTTTGAQRYTGATTLTANNLLTTNGGDIAFASTINGPFQLSVQTIPTGIPVAGTVGFGGAVMVSNLAIRANAATTVAGNKVGTLAANVRTGGFTYADTGALTLGTVDGLAGVATNTGAATITSAGLLTVANDVSGTGLILTGTGLTQNDGTTISGVSSSTIVLDGNDGAITLAGGVTTGNGGANAVLIRDAGNVQLANISTGSGGTLTLGAAGVDNLSGAVTQLAGTTLSVGTLAGNIGGSATLTNANSIGTLGAFTATGINLRTAFGLSVTGPVNAGTGDLTLTIGGTPLSLVGNLSTTGTVTFNVTGTITQDPGSVITANILTGSSSASAFLVGANQIANLGSFTTGNSFSLTDARALTVTSDESYTGVLTLNAIGIDFTGRTLTAGGPATLDAKTGALIGTTVTGANVTGSGNTIAIVTANAGTTPTGALMLSAVNGLSLTTGKAGQSINLSTTNGALTSTGSLTAGTAGNTASTTSITTSSGGATTIASAVSNNGGVSITGGSATVTTATATNGALAITSNAGALSLGTGNAGTTAMLSATGTPAATGTLDITTSLTAGTNATTSSTGATTIAAVTGTAGSVSVTGASATVGTATAGTTMLIRGTSGAVTLGTGDAGGAATLDAFGATGTLDITNRLNAGSAMLTAGAAATIKQVTTTGAASLQALSATSMRIDAGTTLGLTTTNGALSLGIGSAGTTATLSATGTPAATGTLDVTTSLTSGGVASLTATGAINAASVESTGASVLIKGASATVPFAKSKTTLTVQATGGDVSLTNGVTTGPGGNASVSATGNVALGTLGTLAAPIQGSATVMAGGTLIGTSVVSTGTAMLTATGALTLATLKGAGASATGLSVDIGQATATGALMLKATGGTLTLDTGNASGTADLTATGTVAVTTSLTSGAKATLTSSAGAVQVPLVTATGGDIVITAATGVNGGGTARANLSANGADGDIGVVTGGLAFLGPVASTLTAAVQAGTIDLSTVTTGALTLTSSGDTKLGTGTVGSAMLTIGGKLDATTLTATGAVNGMVTGAATVDSVSGSTVGLTAGSATIGSVTANTGALALTTTTGNLSLATGAAATTATLQSAGTLGVTTSLIAGNSGAANGNVTTTSIGASTIASVQSKTGSVSVTGSSANVTTANASTTLLIRGSAGAVTLGTGDAGGAATLDAVGANGTLAITTRLNAASAMLTAGAAATVQALTTTGAASLNALSANVVQVNAGGTLGLTTTGGLLTLGTGTSGGAATLNATGPLAITTSLTSANSATTTSSGATTIATITANGGAVGVTGASANVTNATASGALLIRGTAGAVTLGTGDAGGAATLDAVGAAGTLDITTRLNAASAVLTAGAAATVQALTTTGAASLNALSANVTQVNAGTMLDLMTTGGLLSLGTGMSGGAATLSASGPLAITTSLISADSATTSSTGATTIGTITANGGAVSVTGLSADVANASASTALLIRGTAGGVTLGTGSAGGAATLDAIGADSALGVTGSLTAASAGLTAGGLATINQATTTTGELGIQAATATITTVDAKTTLGIATSAGALTLDKGTSGGAATLSATGPLAITTSLTSGGGVTTTSTGATTIAAITGTGSAVSVTGATVEVTSATAGTTLLLRGTAGGVTLGTGSAGGAATLDAVGAGSALGVTGSLTAASATLTAGGAATIAQVTTTGATSLQAASAAVTGANAGTTLALTTTGGNLSLGTGVAGTTATLQSAGTLAVTTSLIGGNNNAANGNVATTSTGATTIASVQSKTGSISVVGASDAVASANAATTLLLRGTSGAVALGTGDAGGAATLNAATTLDITTRLNAASATLTAGTAATVLKLTTTGATSLTAATANVTQVDAATTLGLTTTGGLLTLGTGTSGGAATLSATGPLAITTSLTSANSATTMSTGATMIGAITANGGALSVTGQSATVGTATGNTTVLIRGTAGAVTLGTGTAGGAATVDAVGGGSALSITNGLTAASATLTAGGAATVARATTTTGALSVQAVSANITTADAKTTLGVTTSGGALTLDTGTSGAAATLNAAGPLSITTSLVSAAGATTTATGATTIGTITANGGAVAVTGQSVQIASARGSTTLDATATGGNLTLGTGTASNGAATLKATGALATTTGLTATGAVAITAGAAATLGTTTSSGAAVTVNAATIAAGQTAAATTLSFTSTGNLSLSGNSTTGTSATFDAGGTAALGQLIASGTGSTITVKALDAAITGTQRASIVQFVNRTPAGNVVKLGDNTSAGGFALSTAEVNFVDAGQLTIDGGTGNVEIGALGFATTAGATRVDVLATGRIDMSAMVTGTGTGRTFRFGGSAANLTDKAAVIRIAATASAGGRLDVGAADLDLRGAKIGVGQDAGFLMPLGLIAGGTPPLSAGTVASDYIANPNSSLYSASFAGGTMYTSTAPLIVAKSLTVRYTDYALFQNTGGTGTSKGVALATSTNPSMPALTIIGSGSNNAFAIFGLLNGIGDSAAAVSGSSVIQVTGADLSNTRVNGCLAGSGAGCLTSVVSQPLINIFDSSRLAVFRAADDLALPFDPVVGTNNEALFSGFGLIDSPVTDTECSADTTSPGCGQSREQGK